MNLARAVYHDADIFLLDDPLSAVDAAVAAHLFNKFVHAYNACHMTRILCLNYICSCIRGLLSEHLVILVTHQLQFALEADKILVVKEVISQTKILAGCTYLLQLNNPLVYCGCASCMCNTNLLVILIGLARALWQL